MGRDFELKYRADARTIENIQEKFGDFTPISMETSYYDTPHSDFARRRWTLRRRWENGVGVCTLKTPAADGSRCEWEVPCDDIHSGIELLCKLGAPEELALLAENGLALSCGARFTRLAKTIDLGDAVVELALDRGVFLAGEMEEPFAEVEAELKDGSEEAVLLFAARLAREFSLEVQPLSKHARAMLLIASP